MNPLIQTLQEAFPEKVEAVEVSNYPTVKIAAADLVAIMQYLKDEQNFDYLANLCSIDYPEEDAFEIVYFLHSLKEREKRIQVKVRTAHNRPEVPSITAVYPGANWQEREEYDLMGITFTDHPNLVRVLLPDNFEGHPLRKDFKGVNVKP